MGAASARQVAAASVVRKFFEASPYRFGNRKLCLIVAICGHLYMPVPTYHKSVKSMDVRLRSPALGEPV